MTGLSEGMSATLTYVVDSGDTATALGSGDVPVLATPRLVAWMEAATVTAVAGGLDAGATTVGTRVEVDHVAPSPIGATVRVVAEVAAVEGRALRFTVTASESAGGPASGPAVDSSEIGRGVMHRVIVDREQFIHRLNR